MEKIIREKSRINKFVLTILMDKRILLICLVNFTQILINKIIFIIYFVITIYFHN